MEAGRAEEKVPGPPGRQGVAWPWVGRGVVGRSGQILDYVESRANIIW